MSIDMAQFHQVFFEESFEGLDVMESGLLDMNPGDPDEDQINAIFRAAHSIKGGSGTFGFSNISDFTHIMETLLDEMRDGSRQVTTEATDVLLKSVDVLRDMLEAAQDEGNPDQAKVDETYTALKAILEGKSSEALAEESTPSSDSPANEEPTSSTIVGWHIVFRPHQNLLKTGNDPLRIIHELEELGEVTLQCDIDGIPDFKSYQPEDSYLSWDIKLKGDIDEYKIQEIFDWIEDECDLVVMPVYDESVQDTSGVEADVSTASQPEQPAQQQEVKTASSTPTNKETKKAVTKASSKAASSSGGSIRVDTSKIDSLINMVGELVITQSMLGMLGENFTMEKIGNLQEGLVTLERHTRELQESVMQVRMMPISFTFSRFPRLVRDLSSKMDKKIELKMTGENTEVDKTVIEKIGDPLVHLVRNSLDHGIEQPEVRVAAGKPEKGTVGLNAYHKGGNIVIEITDDGAGMDAEFLRQKAIGKGLISESDPMTENQCYELIFMPGFSTAEQLSDISGRGVGMDVVRRNINELGGAIEIQSELGVGSTMTIRLPLTLAILDGQSISVGDETYIVPLVSIIESIQISEENTNKVTGQGEAFKLRDEYLPIIRLHEILDVKSAKATKLTEGLLVVVEAEGKKCGLFVDDLQGQHQVVIKSLDVNYRSVDGISGATILGDGSVALILDVPGIFHLSARDRRITPFRKSA